MKIIFAVPLILVLSAVGVVADQGRVEIGPTDSFPIVINTPGSYVLTSDLHVTATSTDGIQINVDDVTLDLGGHVLRGPGEDANGGIGIYGYNRSNISIRNGTVTEFNAGISLGASSSHMAVNRFRDLTVSHCGYGGFVFSGGSARDIVVHNNGMAGLVSSGFSCSRCSISNVTARANFEGISVFKGSAQNCTAGDNFNKGIRLRYATLNGGSAFENGGHGIHLSFTSSAIAVSVTDNGGYGILLDSEGSNNAVNCTGSNNTLGNQSGCGDGNGCHQNYLP